MKSKVTYLSLFIVSSLFFTTISYAQINIDSLLNQIRFLKEDTFKVNKLYSAAELLVNKNNQLTDSLANECLKLSDKLNYTYGKAKSYFYLGKIAKYSSDYKSALNRLSLSKTFYESINDHANAMRVNVEICSVKLRQGDFDEVLKLSNEIIDFSDSTNNLKLKYLALNQINIVYQKQGNFEEALKYTLQCAAYNEKSGEKNLLATDYNNVGILLKNIGDYEKSLEYHFKALAIRRDLNLESGIAQSLGNIAVVYNRSEKYDLAIKYSKDALKLNEKLNDKNGISNNLGNLGISYQHLKNYKEALKYNKQVLDIDLQLGQKGEIASDYLNLASLYFDLENYSNCLQFLDKAEPIATELKILTTLENISNFRSKIAAKQHDKISAYEDLQKSVKFRDSVYSVESTKQMQELLIQYETEKKDKEILKNTAELIQKELDVKAKNDALQLLQMDTLVRTADLQKQKVISIATISFTVLLLLLAAVLFSRFKLRKKIESQQALLNERKRISNELHDDLGAQLSTARMFLSNLTNNTDTTNSAALIQHSINLIDSSIGELRNIMDDLQTSVLHNKGYIIATEELVNKINTLQKVTFTLSTTGIEKRMETKIEHQLFRITQELINNTLKYAKALNVSIDLIARDGNIILFYEDDGVGFDITNVKRGYGLSNIEKRTFSLNGVLEIDSIIGKGARTIIEIPLKYAT